MHTLALCLLALACSVSAKVEELVAADKAESVVKRSVDDDFETMLEQLEKKYVGGSKAESNRDYKGLNDIYVDKRYRPVYSDHSSVRDQDKMTSVTDAQKQEILDLHNKLRRQEGSSNMEKLHHNADLASRGQQWCERCQFEHGQPDGKTGIGQNIYAHESKEYGKFVADALNAWYDEKKDYDYNGMSCAGGKVCGHYTAFTWGDTNEVGCGLCFCPSIGGLRDAHFIVCNYLPGGNWGGQKNHLKGTPCTQCSSGKFFCDDGLCDSTCNSPGANCECKADCKKCGEKDDAACTCKCKEGTTGPDCSEECQDLDPQCGANPGYPDMTCNMGGFEFVKDKCPKMCGKCKSAPAGAAPCSKAEEGKSLKRLMLNFLQKEEKEGRLDKK